MRFLFLLTSFAFACLTAGAQDILTKTDGVDLKVKVTEVTPSEVKYKLYDNLEGPLYTLPKAKVFSLTYQNGTKEVFPIPEPNAVGNLPAAQPAVQPIPATSQEMYAKGRSDASRQYEGYKGAGTGTLLVGLLSPALGLIPAFACSATPPKENNLGYSDRTLMQNADYRQGYTRGSKKIKSRKVWSNLGIAFGVNVFAVLYLATGTR
jgi:hypothetical protein